MELDLNTDLTRLLPPWYREIEDYRQICNAEEAQFKRLASGIDAVQNGFFPQSMDVDSVQRWEQIFHIRADPAVEPLEFRRQRVLTRLRIRPPYTMTFLYQQLDELLGAENWMCRINYPGYTLSVSPNIETQAFFSEMLRLIHAVKPAHIVLENIPYLRTSVLLSERIDASYRTLNYRLGRWNLGRLPFGSDGEASQRKSPQDASLTGVLIQRTAGILSDTLSESRFNDKVTGSSLEKAIAPDADVSGQMLTVKTTVPDGISYLTAYELLDQQKTPAVRCPLRFPVVDPTGLTLQLAVLENADTIRYTKRYLFDNGKQSRCVTDENPAYTARLGRSAVLQETLLHQAAQHLAASITAVRLNGSIVRKKLRIQVSGSSLTVSHEIAAPEEVKTITSLELLSGDVPLTYSVVSIPVQEITVVTHTIYLQEGVYNG